MCRLHCVWVVRCSTPRRKNGELSLNCIKFLRFINFNFSAVPFAGSSEEYAIKNWEIIKQTPLLQLHRLSRIIEDTFCLSFDCLNRHLVQSLHNRRDRGNIYSDFMRVLEVSLKFMAFKRGQRILAGERNVIISSEAITVCGQPLND